MLPTTNIDVRASLLASLAATAREYGHTGATDYNIFREPSFRRFSLETLTRLRKSGDYDSKPILAEIDKLITELSGPAPAAIARPIVIGANLSDLFFNTDASDCAANPDPAGEWNGYDDDKLRAHARQFLETFRRAVVEVDPPAGWVFDPNGEVSDDFVTALVEDFLRRQ